MIPCPLCGAPQNTGANVDTQGLIGLWERFGVPVRRLFGTAAIARYTCAACGLGFYHPFIPGDGEFYNAVGAWDDYYTHTGKTEFPFVASLISPGQHVIDVGSGIGEFSSFMPAGSQYVGVELSTAAVEKARSLGRDVRRMNIIDCDDEHAAAYDVVACFQVLEHIDNIHEFFPALLRLSKPGGIAAVAVPNNDGFVGTAINNMLNLPPHHVLLWNRTSLEYLAGSYGLTIEQYVVEPLQGIHRRWAHTVVITRALCRLVNIRYAPVDRTLFTRIIAKFASKVSLLTTLLVPALVESGHSSIIILRTPQGV
jgi:2-polyprenyl-3-methyl-5-hydroxy-6-metoxy-1,4-benzoquinol methylase